MHKTDWVCILTNRSPGTLCLGVTNSLRRRIRQHRAGRNGGLSRRYGLDQLVYFEGYGNVRQAIARGPQLKGWLRRRKSDLIEAGNPPWKDLSVELLESVPLDSSLRSE